SLTPRAASRAIRRSATSPRTRASRKCSTACSRRTVWVTSSSRKRITPTTAWCRSSKAPSAATKRARSPSNASRKRETPQPGERPAYAGRSPGWLLREPHVSRGGPALSSPLSPKKGGRMAEKITPRGNDYSQWYQDVVKEAGLAENSDVRGCMVIKPHGYAIWEKMQRALDRMFKDTGHVNAYFPLFIPKRFLEKE